MQDASRFRYEADLATAVKDVFRTSGSYDMARKRLPDRIEPILRKVEEEEAAAALLLMLIAMDDDDGQLTQGLLRAVPSAVARDGYPRQRAEKLSTDIVTNSVEQGVAVQDAMPDERAETIGVTEVTGAVSQGAQTARDIGGGAAGEQGFRVEFYWVTSKDDKVCPVCRPLDGEPEAFWRDKFPMGPPGHPRCRCVAEPRMVPRNRITRESFNEEDHPRGDDGKFISKGDIAAAKTDPAKADELRARVTDKAERAKLEKELGGKQSDATPSPKINPTVHAWAEKKFKDPEKAKNFATWFGDSKVVDEKGEPLVVYTGQPSGLNEIPQVDRTELPVGHAFFTTDKDVATQYSTGDYSTDRKGAVYASHLSIQRPFNSDHVAEDDLAEIVLGHSGEYSVRDIAGELGFDEFRDDDTGKLIGWESRKGKTFYRSEDNDLGDMLKAAWEDRSGSGDTLEYAIKDSPGAIAAVLFPDNAKSHFEQRGHDGIIFKDAEMGGTTMVPIKPSQIKSATGNRGTFDPKSDNINEAIRRFVARFN